jgi:hypothetical protein
MESARLGQGKLKLKRARCVRKQRHGIQADFRQR